jgi:hypothetical protein
MSIRQLSNVNSWHRIYSCMNCFVHQYISRRKKIMKKPVKSIIKDCYIINVVLANAYITSRRIDSAVMELEVWKINHAGRPVPLRKKPDRLQLWFQCSSDAESSVLQWHQCRCFQCFSASVALGSSVCTERQCRW